MKKTYLNPELIVVKIATRQMLAGSPGDETMSGQGDLGDGEGFSFGARDGDFDED